VAASPVRATDPDIGTAALSTERALTLAPLTRPGDMRRCQRLEARWGLAVLARWWRVVALVSEAKDVLGDRAEFAVEPLGERGQAVEGFLA
jgi:hypothetical protein